MGAEDFNFVTISEKDPLIIIKRSMRWEDIDFILRQGTSQCNKRLVWQVGRPEDGHLVLHAEKCMTSRACIGTTAGCSGIFEYTADTSEVITAVLAFGTTDVQKFFGGPGEKHVAALLRPKLFRPAEVNFVVIGRRISKPEVIQPPPSKKVAFADDVSLLTSSGSAGGPTTSIEPADHKIEHDSNWWCPYCEFYRNSAGSAPLKTLEQVERSEGYEKKADFVTSLESLCLEDPVEIEKLKQKENDGGEREMVELLSDSLMDIGVCSLPERRSRFSWITATKRKLNAAGSSSSRATNDKTTATSLHSMDCLSAAVQMLTNDDVLTISSDDDDEKKGADSVADFDIDDDFLAATSSAAAADNDVYNTSMSAADQSKTEEMHYEDCKKCPSDEAFDLVDDSLVLKTIVSTDSFISDEDNVEGNGRRNGITFKRPIATWIDVFASVEDNKLSSLAPPSLTSYYFADNVEGDDGTDVENNGFTLCGRQSQRRDPEFKMPPFTIKAELSSSSPTAGNPTPPTTKKSHGFLRFHPPAVSAATAAIVANKMRSRLVSVAQAASKKIRLPNLPLTTS